MHRLATISRAVFIVPIILGVLPAGLAAVFRWPEYSFWLYLFLTGFMAVWCVLLIGFGVAGWRNGKDGLVATAEGLRWCENMFSMRPRHMQLRWDEIESVALFTLSAVDPDDVGLLFVLRPGVPNRSINTWLIERTRYLPKSMRQAIGEHDPGRIIIAYNNEWMWDPKEVEQFIKDRITSAKA